MSWTSLNSDVGFECNEVGTASMVTIPSDNYHHTPSLAKMKFISLSFSFVRQFLRLQTRLIE